MATTKTPATTPAEEKKDAKTMTLAQKFVELRKACPEIIKKQHSDGVKYKFAKIFDVYELLAPAMNEWGVDWEIIKEEATRHYENGDDMYFSSYIQHTRNGERVVWIYEADLTLCWINVDNPDERQYVELHALGTNDSGPDKAKGSALTYALKYYLFEKFMIDQGEEDPDMKDHSSDAHPAAYNSNQQKSSGLSEAQLNRLYKKAENCGMNKEKTNKRIREVYNQDNPAALTRAQYDEICNNLDASAAKKKEEQQNAE